MAERSGVCTVSGGAAVADGGDEKGEAGMRIGLIDVDGHNFPNLALMRISAYHKAIGDQVEWWCDLVHYDIVYMSKIFPTHTAKIFRSRPTQTAL